MMGGLAANAFQVAGLSCLLVAALWDLRVRLIPNQLVVLVALAGFAAQLATAGWFAVLSLAIAFAVLLGLGVLCGRGLIGGGDAKMIAATSLLVTPAMVPALLLAIAAIGGLLAVIALAVNLPAWRSADWSEILHRPALPYGVAIAAGTGFVVLRGML